VLDITHHINTLADHVHHSLESRQRIVVAIAGAPASGKSTIAAELARRLNTQKTSAVVVPMDGFHLDNAILDDRGLRPRKGAPETFDAAGFVHMIRRIKFGEEVVIPVFDRPRDIAIAGASIVSPDCQVVIVEGNYLMFDQAPWTDLVGLWDLTARLDVPITELRARLIQRWLNHGLSRAAATRRAEGNDVPNAQAIVEKALPCDVILDGQPRR
jgi:pantothenate kinase